MNTNSNLYTVIYSAIIVTLVAAILAFASVSLRPKQEANAKAETISQMLSAAHFASKDSLSALANEQILSLYAENIAEAFIINLNGEKIASLNTGKEGLNKIELIENLKQENTSLKKDPSAVKLPVYIFNKDGKKITVIPIYGAGLWGPIWGYFAFDPNMSTIIGAYFDHESETPGLGAKIKDDPAFRTEFDGKSVDFADSVLFSIVKGGVAVNNNHTVDAITGATMTCNGLNDAINIWFRAYKKYFLANGAKALQDSSCSGGSCSTSCCNEAAENTCAKVCTDGKCNVCNCDECNKECSKQAYNHGSSSCCGTK